MTRPPVCEKCQQPMKPVVYGLPSPQDFENSNVIYAGCLIDYPPREWDCDCFISYDFDANFEIVVADITTLDVDCIVNSANPLLIAGGGVCGAIHKAAGPELELECLRIAPNGIEAGTVIATKGFNLHAKHVVHAVVPKFHESGIEGMRLVESAYREAILAADAIGSRSVAIPSLGTGIYGWDVGAVAPFVIKSIKDTLPQLENLEIVSLCCFTQEDADIYRAALIEHVRV